MTCLRCKLLFIALLTFTVCAFGQAGVKVVVIPKNAVSKQPHLCTISVYNQADTSLVSNMMVVTYDREHEFYIEGGKRYFVRCIPQKTVLTENGYEKNVRDDEFEEEWVDLDLVSCKDNLVVLDSIYIKKRMSKTLDEAVVTSSRILFYHHGDTLIYNASAFVLSEGSMLDALVEQLPGVKIDADGVIHCNGRRVDDLLLNGKDLFNGRNELMLENLAAYTVKDIAVYDKRGTLSEMVGRNLREDTRHVMDVRLKRDYLTGGLVNAEAGYGTEGRYLGKLFGIGFTDMGSISAYGGVNNLSDRNKPGKTDGSWTRDRMGNGVHEKQQGGLSYTFEGPVSVRGSADVSNDKDDIRQSVETELYLPDENRREYMKSERLERNLSVVTQHVLSLRPHKRLSLTFMPEFEYGRNKSTGLIRSFATGDTYENGEDFDRIMTGEISPASLIYRNRSMSRRDGKRLSGSMGASAQIAFGQDYMSLYMRGNYSNTRQDGYNGYSIKYNDMASADVNDLQYRKNHPDYVRDISARAGYVKYVGWHGLNLSARYSLDRGKTVNTDELYVPDVMPDVALISGLDDLGALGWLKNTALSYGMMQRHMMHKLELGGYNQSTFSLSDGVGLFVNLQELSLGFSSRDLTFTSVMPAEIHRNSVLPAVKAQINLSNFKKKTYVTLNLQSEVRDVNMRDLVDLPQTDPLVRYLGNGDLKNPWVSDIILNIRHEAGQKNHSGRLRYLGVSDKVAQSYVYNTTTGLRSFRPYNVDGDWTTEGNYEFFMPFGKGNCLDLTSNTTGRIGRDVNFVGVSAKTDTEADFAARERRVVRSYGVGESLSLNYTFRRNRVSVFGNVMMNDYRSRDAGFSDFVSWTANYGGTAVLNLPYDWSVSTDLTMYMRRGYNDRRLNTTDLLWNARVTKTVFKGRVVLAADAYDILRQLSNVTYLVSALSRTETVSNVVPSYVLFHVQYRFNMK